jgi:hypothetical protein
MKRRRPASQRLAGQALELAWAAPQVVARRVARLSRAGASPSAADRREFAVMGAEKVAAFWQSWAAMGALAWQTQWQLWQAWLPLAWGAAPRAWPGAAQRSTEAVSRLLAAGLAPVHGRAVGNARRLARRR